MLLPLSPLKWVTGPAWIQEEGTTSKYGYGGYGSSKGDIFAKQLSKIASVAVWINSSKDFRDHKILKSYYQQADYEDNLVYSAELSQNLL
jgi:hypothetical protein